MLVFVLKEKNWKKQPFQKYNSDIFVVGLPEAIKLVHDNFSRIYDEVARNYH